MQTWLNPAPAGMHLVLAADARFCEPDYTDDIIWVLHASGGSPPALALETTFGLRASEVRLFPRFWSAERCVSDPLQFFSPLRLVSILSSYVAVNFQPYEGIDVLAEYWVPQSHAVTGRFRITNSLPSTVSLGFEWVGMLTPLGEGQRMQSVPMGASASLQAASGGLSPVCVLTGGARAASNPYPALFIDLELPSGTHRQVTWALAALPSTPDSLDLARHTTARPWDAEIARLELENAACMLEITTGDPAWDAAFHLAQQAAFSLFFPARGGLPNSSFVLSRQPDQGCSMRGDGSDYSHHWDGQTPLDALTITGLLLPARPDLAEGLLLNFLSAREENGLLDLKPGMGGQRMHRLATPLLATLAWRIDQFKDDHSWLQDVYPGLLHFLQSWLQPRQDRDGDGFPEVDHPLQTGLEENPLYDRWFSGSQGVDIDCLESPGMAAFLVRECTSLMKISRRLNREDDLAWLENTSSRLRQAVETTWNPRAGTYQYRDYETHRTHDAMHIHTARKSGKSSLHRSLKFPQRLLIRLKSRTEASHPVHILLSGEGPAGAITEELSPMNFRWNQGLARSTTRNAFTRIHSVDVKGLTPGDEAAFYTVDFTSQDLTLLLPLWARIPDAERARTLLEKTLLHNYLQPFGLPAVPPHHRPPEPASLAAVHMPLNILIGEGLLAYGFNQQAATLTSNLMQACVAESGLSLTFRQYYDALDGHSWGEPGSLRGLPPLELFLQTLGVPVIQNNRVILRGNNPFPWPVTVKYQGMTITRHSEDTVITFPSGETVSVIGEGPHQVTLS